ncbi:MAG: iron chelate uptake ABC transporter family permease subunit [Gammaproteobacteria bacterium]|nr:iron chelate uptake ABC transporter family permease subunit [Gammaproteobacteria bacterium]
MSICFFNVSQPESNAHFAISFHIGLSLLSYSKYRARGTLGGLVIILIVASLYSLSAGAIDTSMFETLRATAQFLGLVPMDQDNNSLPQILGQIRIPRLILAIIVGGGLAITGTVLQALFRNPMADPGLLGVSSGAAFGAAATIVFGVSFFAQAFAVFGNWLLILVAFAGSFISLSVVYRLATFNRRTDIPTMLLAGVAVNAITGAMIGLLSYIASDTQLRDLIFWSLGSLGITDWWKLGATALIATPACFALLFHARALNANLLGESEARHLGFDVEKIKKRLIILVALVVSVVVAVSGVIGFVGLVVPHLLRLVVGPDHRLLLPASALAGAILLIMADIIARTIVAPAEIPIGIITAVLGGPFFLGLLIRHKRKQVF